MAKITVGPEIEISYSSGSLSQGHFSQGISNLLTFEEIEKFNLFVYSLQSKLKSVNGSLSLESLLLETKSPRTPQTPETPIPKLCHHSGKGCVRNCVRGFIKTFTMAFLVKYTTAVLPALLTGKIMKRPEILKEMAGRDTAGFAVFLAAFTSSYNGILCALRRYRNTESRSNSIVAGTLAGLTLAFDQSKTRRQSIMIYLMVRALQFNSSYLMKKWAIKRQQDHPGETKWDDRVANFLTRYAGVLLMTVVSSQTIFAFLFHPDTLQKPYRSFLSEHINFKSNFGEKEKDAVRAFGPTVNRINTECGSIKTPPGLTSREYVAQYVSPGLADKVAPNIHHKYASCTISHPLYESCLVDRRHLFQGEMLRTLKLYGVLNLFILILFKSKKIVTNPIGTVQRLIKSTVRSALFLTMNSVTGVSTPCILKRLTGRDQPWFYYAAGAVGGSMAFIETPGRQIENGLYCLARALEAIWARALNNGQVKNLPHGEILLFMMSMGVLMPVYQHDKDVIGSTYLAVMTRLFGEN